uniref:DNA polymerase III subunit alpha n=1 Tax=Candidatus Kentrum sp. DK TaxID=2126562 RepID=A0A450RYB3_9GAMM|nr:MAG: DNA polymerase III, alpha subunit [Candidatus Kentron sp. DK]
MPSAPTSLPLGTNPDDPGRANRFVHLHLHTEYSLVDGIIRIPALMEGVLAADMPAVAVTDHSNLFAVVKFYRAAVAAGIKPIIGADVWISDSDDPKQASRLILLCRNRQGYRNLSRLISKGYTAGQQGDVPVIHTDWLLGATEGLIALSGGLGGAIGKALVQRKIQEARDWCERFQALFPDCFYLELTRTGREGEPMFEEGVLALALERDLPVVATNEVCFLRPDDFEVHEARVCIRDGLLLADPRRPHRYSPDQYLRTPKQMIDLFADIPEAIENTVEIARRCNVAFEFGENYLPDFPVREGSSLDIWFREQSRQGLETRLATLFDPQSPDFPTWRAPYDERLETELDVIIGMGYSGYFLIVSDFIRWAKENGVPVGPGRGSGAGSLVAYALGITDLDPIRYDLLFERFLNPERVSLPDFDVDFCMEGRDRVIEYVTERYGGSELVAQIITFGTMAAKAVVRDVGRILGHPYGFVDQIAKLIPFDLGITLEKALEQEEILRQRYEKEEDVRALIDLARELEGLARNAGRHAGGVVIAPRPLTEFTALYCEKGASGVVTQLDKDDVESVGLVKFDFLGLRTLTIIDWTLRNIQRFQAQNNQDPQNLPPLPDISTLPLDDKKTFDLIKQGATSAVFQLESRGMRDLIRRLQPDCFEDVIALVALFRPGPLQSGMVDDFIERKHGKARVIYPHPDLEPALKPTYGVILYQEQVMQIARVLAGYTLGGADLLRRAMGKKKASEMAKQRSIFVSGAQARGVAENTATEIFDLMEKFAGYGFNKSHSAAYALIAYQTAWLKAHYPAAFMAAVLSAEMDKTEKVVASIDECRSLGLAILPPDINRCEFQFTVHDEGAIRYGLGAVKGAGEAALQGMLAERKEHGPFTDIFDLCRRVDTRRMNRRVLDALTRAGALDSLGPSRVTVFHSLDTAIRAAEQHNQVQSNGQQDMFGGAIEQQDAIAAFSQGREWTEMERLTGEKETLGLYLTGHPMDRHRRELAAFTRALADVRPALGQQVKVAGLVMQLRARRGKDGRENRRVDFTLDDGSAHLEAVAYAQIYQNHKELLAKDNLVIVAGEVTMDDFIGERRMTVREVMSLEQARENLARALVLSLDGDLMAAMANSGTGNDAGGGQGNNSRPNGSSGGPAARLAEIIEPHRGGNTPILVDYHAANTTARLALGDGWRVRPAEALLEGLRALLGEERVVVWYGGNGDPLRLSGSNSSG